VAIIEANPKVSAWRQQIEQLHHDIADLENGSFEMWSQVLNEPKELENPSMIAHAKEVIRMYEYLIEQEELKRRS
jgi:hypothetical protein